MPTPTWDRLPAAKRDAVLAAAEAEFGERGFSGASLNTISREAGISKGSLFQYFVDKADMYAHLAELASLRIRAAMEAEVARLPVDTDFFGSFDALLKAWVGYFHDHPRDRALTAATNLEPDALARAAVRDTVNRHYLEVITPLVELAHDSGQLRADTDRDALIALLLLLLPHLALAPHVNGLDPVLGLQEGDRDHATVQARRMLRLILDPHRPTPRSPTADTTS
ncbi:TetR/AcrR family transcriptional regulator [Nocardiopsis sp. ATB16-24]|uniref:TetR/AcrR family transcriptional regulator n=1 Tax=Nocardiopsis sp. ATB16-24 TaxID=3019555 RepID=UPI0025529483|nr:TetR/AcrR family transcriptional regulator [Nocardiopsis sp. ATB16-24]